jgi:hypothetical protein
MDKYLAAYLAASYVTVEFATREAELYVLWINAQTSESAAIQALLEAATQSTNYDSVLTQATALLASNVPTVTAISLASGTTAGGVALTLTGTNLLGVTGVTFGGTAATVVKATSDTTVTLVSPAHASGAVSVVLTTTAGSVTKTTFYTYV